MSWFGDFEHHLKKYLLEIILYIYYIIFPFFLGDVKKYDIY